MTARKRKGPAIVTMGACRSRCEVHGKFGWHGEQNVGKMFETRCEKRVCKCVKGQRLDMHVLQFDSGLAKFPQSDFAELKLVDLWCTFEPFTFNQIIGEIFNQKTTETSRSVQFSQKVKTIPSEQDKNVNMKFLEANAKDARYSRFTNATWQHCKPSL